MRAIRTQERLSAPCFIAALRHALDRAQEPETMLVHETRLVGGEPLESHAWVESAGERLHMRCDAGRCPVDPADAVAGVLFQQRYSPVTAAVLLLQAGHPGPW